jgi:hypothetical protein
MAVAAKRLNVPAQKIAELAGRGTIRWEKDFLNQRVKLVEYHEVRKAFSLSRYYRDQMK